MTRDIGKTPLTPTRDLGWISHSNYHDRSRLESSFVLLLLTESFLGTTCKYSEKNITFREGNT